MTSFIEQALILLSAAVILVPIFQRLGLGSVLGYLIAGILIGPQGFKLIRDAESIAHFSELGVVFLLFLIGLEIQPRKLWSMRRHLVGLGGLQVLSCSLVFAGAAIALGLPPMVGAILGFALSLSSTAFAVQTLMEKNLLNSEFGRGSFAILLTQDLVAIPALAIIPALLVTQEGGGSSISGISLGLFTILGLVVVSRFLIRPIFRFIASTQMRDLFTAMTLFIVIGVGVLIQKIGLSAALGAFIAGVLLSDSEYRHELEINIEPFKGLLMGLFFIAVGMGVSIQLIAAQPLTVLGLTLGYLAIKGLLIYASGRLFKMNHNNSKAMAVSIIQGGEFAFVIFGVLASLNVVPSETLALLTAVITMSMALSPLTNILDERCARMAKHKEVEPDYDEMKDEAPQVIIAGYGRFGQIFGRILRAQGIAFVGIEHDPTQIELLRKFGTTVYYGDASREDLLEKAGAARAKYFILAIDDVEASMQAARLVREKFPNLKVYARARNRGHVFDLMDLGIESIKRETFDSSLLFVRDLLVDLGFEVQKAQRLVDKFRQHDEIMLKEQFKVRADDKSMVSLAKQSTAQLAQVLSDDSMQSHIAPNP